MSGDLQGSQGGSTRKKTQDCPFLPSLLNVQTQELLVCSKCEQS